MHLAILNIDKLKKFEFNEIRIIFLNEEIADDGWSIQRNFLVNGERWGNIGADNLNESIAHVRKTYKDVLELKYAISNSQKR